MTQPSPLVLASSSPRRQYLLKEAGFIFTVEKPNVEEDFPSSLPVAKIASYLAKKKADSFLTHIENKTIVSADTVVILGVEVLNKPADRTEAIAMLENLSGKTHQVITGVCIASHSKEVLFDDVTDVTFKNLKRSEIEFYVDNYQPYDKAGSYGAQDWIGMVAIEKIVGSYFNVMGLPIDKVYTQLVNW